MRKIINLLLLISIVSLLSCSNEPNHTVGQWKGSVEISGQKLNMIFNIEENNGKPSAKLYSINQSKTAIPASEVLYNHDTKALQINIPSIAAVYQGKVTDDNTILGTLTQHNINMVLDLQRISIDEYNQLLGYDLEDNDAFDAENITFRNNKENITLAGTITLPKNTENYPAVVLVTGSGAQNRDEEIMGHKPFKRLAEFLSANGIAVLRYDERGVAASEGDFQAATTADFFEDAMCAVEFIRNYKDVDPNKVGLIGHSEGGLIASMAAAAQKVDFIVELGGPVLRGDDLILLQADKLNKAYGLSDEDINAAHTLNSTIYTIVTNEQDLKKAKLDIMATIKHYAMNEEMKKDVTVERMANSVLTPWYRFFLASNPGEYIKDIKCPVLFLFGEKDLQVPAKENEDALYTLMNHKMPVNFTIITVTNVNHLFQKAETGLIEEYSNLDNPSMNDESLEIIFNWLKNTVL